MTKQLAEVQQTTVVLATSNPGKTLEFRRLLRALPIQLVAAHELLGMSWKVDEDADTLEGNAIKKARAIANETMLLTLADDSGLEVDALGGAPGVHSARFAGDGATAQQRNAALLEAMRDVPEGVRTARFRCVLCLVDPWVLGAGAGSDIVTCSGVCEGSIGFEARGDGGFGYDPLFVVDGQGCTMAQLLPEEKDQLSHRGRAAAAMCDEIRKVLQRRLDNVKVDRLG